MFRTIGRLNDPSSPHAVFAPACFKHGMNLTPLFQSVQINGISAQDQLIAWLYEEDKITAISLCDGLNCEETCPEMDDCAAFPPGLF